MSWDEATLAVLGATGMVALLLIMLWEVLLKVLEVIQAWRTVRRALRTPSSNDDHVT
ncbi:hypothetical protein [Actinomadura kijaniata]|uniref:hypothetical protein n=1 Tax=Actinomadura kijaniata TaxID=46161 RepID=UPI000A982F3D|nr:hypothetical protein [Actinomadura kijaniata]